MEVVSVGHLQMALNAEHRDCTERPLSISEGGCWRMLCDREIRKQDERWRSRSSGGEKVGRLLAAELPSVCPRPLGHAWA